MRIGFFPFLANESKIITSAFIYLICFLENTSSLCGADTGT